MVISSSSRWEGGVFNQYRAAISGSLCYTIMGAATAWPSPTLIKMANNEAPVVLDITQISWMVSLMFFGHVTSPIPSGYLMDMFGRKKTCLCLSILPFTCWLLTFFASSATHLYVARFTAGLWIGATTTVMPLYVGEIAGPSLRSSLTTINNLLLNFGVLFVYIIGPFVSYFMLAIWCEVLTVVYVLLFASMPESPHYFIKQDQKEKAFEALSWLRKGEPKESIVEEINRIDRALEDQKLQKGSGVLQAYASITLPKTTLGVLDPNMCVMILGIISLVSSVASTALAAMYRRRTLLTISCGGCAVTTAIVMVWFFLNDFTTVTVTNYSDVIFLSFALYYSVFNIGLGPIGTSIKGEVFATNVKALSSSLTTLVVASMGFLVNKYYLIIAHSVGMYVNYLVYSAACVAAIVFTWSYVPDTHNKTLEEIREILRDGIRHNNYNSTS